jgi:hypothetical protein
LSVDTAVKIWCKVVPNKLKQFAVSFLNILANNFLPVIRALGRNSKKENSQ